MADRGAGPCPGFAEALARGPLLLDAAMGTRLIGLGLDLESDDPSAWNLSRPDLVLEVHRRDVRAGADALLTNTFGANQTWLDRKRLSVEVEASNRAAVALAREAADGDRFVIGDLGPTALDRPGALEEQAEVLADEGVDALIFETFRADQAEAALRAVRDRTWLPILVSLVALPGPPGDLGAARRLADLGASAIGSNCQSGMGPTLEVLGRLREATSLPLLAKPSAGLPGRPIAGPDSFGRAVPGLLALGVRLVGGCCGTTERHVRALRAALDAHRPDRPSPGPESIR